MRPDTLSKLAVSVAICAAAASSVAVGLANSRIDDLEIQRDIYKSRAEDWEGTAGVIAQYADDLADELKIRVRWIKSWLSSMPGFSSVPHTAPRNTSTSAARARGSPPAGSQSKRM